MGPAFSRAFIQSLKTLISPLLPPPPPRSRCEEEQHETRIQAQATLVNTLSREKQTAFHDRAVILSLVARLGQHLGLAVGLLNDPNAPEGYQMRLVLELPSGQVSWHLPDEALSFFDDIGTCTGPYAEQPTTQEWERILHPDLERAVLSPPLLSTLPVGVPTGDDLRTDAKTTKRKVVKKKQAREETV